MATYNGADKRLAYLFENGGGGGGGTTVVANPAGDATDELEKLQVANTIYGIPMSVGAVGLFIDTNNVIKATTSIPANTDVSYTATQDCCVRYTLVSNANNQSSVKIDGVPINSTYIPSQLPLITLGGMVYLKKGQEVVLRQSYTQANGSYTVYGLLRGSEGGVYLPACYSTEERQVGCWADGRPLYQKTIDFGALPANTTKYVDHNISNIDTVVDFAAMAKRPSPLTFIPIPTVHWETLGNSEEISFTATQIMIRNHNSNASQFSQCYVTMQYTKTTDTAGSSIWTPNGGYARHYSNNEQIIGTWTDGSTLYEKTVHITALPSTAYTNVNYPHNIANISKITKWEGYGTFASGAVVPLPVPQFNNQGFLNYASIYAQVNTTDISIIAGTDRSSMSADFIIQYTKTT